MDQIFGAVIIEICGNGYCEHPEGLGTEPPVTDPQWIAEPKLRFAVQLVRFWIDNESGRRSVVKSTTLAWETCTQNKIGLLSHTPSLISSLQNRCLLSFTCTSNLKFIHFLVFFPC